MYSKNLVIIGSSTGGPKALSILCSRLPRINASIIIVQHIPGFIIDSLAKSLSRVTDMEVKIAEDDDFLEDGMIYLAPSEIHTELFNNQIIRLKKGKRVNYVCPSVDVTMKSIKKMRRNTIIGVVLTGMGCDGAKGISHIKHIGGITIAQNAETCAVYGMPREAYRTGDVDFVLPPDAIGDKIVELAGLMPVKVR